MVARKVKRILVALPDRDVDPTELAVPSVALRAAGHDLLFSTPSGKQGTADPVMLSGEGIGPFGRFLRADARGRRAYATLAEDAAFRAPCSFGSVGPDDVDALFLPGGHAKGMLPYLESLWLQGLAGELLESGKPVGAICHGVLVVSRARDSKTGRSALHGRKTTALPGRMERMAHALTSRWAADYYRTYPRTVEEEVRAELASHHDFDCGPAMFSPRSVLRDGPDSLDRAFVLTDRHYVSARWPGDAHGFAHRFVQVVSAPVSTAESSSGARASDASL